MTPNILVIGEAMVDRSLVGTAERLSPEAPIPVVKPQSITEQPGGAAKVAAILRSLGASVTPTYQPGYPDAGPVKNRLFVGDTCVARWDEGDHCDPIDVGALPPLGAFDAVVISDYGKGGFTPLVRSRLMELLHAFEVPTFIDTKTSPHAWASFPIFFPNASEYSAHERLYASTPTVVRTLGAGGMELLDHGVRTAFEFPQNLHPRTVIGAGDVVIAAYAYSVACGASPRAALCFAAQQVGRALSSPYGASL
jgi:D-beta-D-heptose 7-phosphate kinase/D-beta-D-heptose 1-phosphate adenosyltransferase